MICRERIVRNDIEEKARRLPQFVGSSLFGGDLPPSPLPASILSPSLTWPSESSSSPVRMRSGAPHLVNPEVGSEWLSSSPGASPAPAASSNLDLTWTATPSKVVPRRDCRRPISFSKVDFGGLLPRSELVRELRAPMRSTSVDSLSR